MTAIIILNSLSAFLVGYLCGQIVGINEKKITRRIISIVIGVCLATVLAVATVRILG